MKIFDCMGLGRKLKKRLYRVGRGYKVPPSLLPEKNFDRTPCAASLP